MHNNKQLLVNKAALILRERTAVDVDMSGLFSPCLNVDAALREALEMTLLVAVRATAFIFNRGSIQSELLLWTQHNFSHSNFLC